MAEAQEESGEDGSDDGQEFEDFEGINVGTDEDDEDGGESGSEEDSDGGSENDSEADDDDEEEDEADEDDDDEEDVPPPSKSQKTKFNPDHLPDELFAAAFATKPKRKTDDIVVGSRAIRVLASSTQPSVPSTLPSKKLEKFLNRTLAFKADDSRGRAGSVDLPISVS
ncbi:hypothetical protein BJ912DRAFT_1111729 [Pholiota molesta]|nr:hypothetical protein BJ912DRAFT_1111729 [Pholiota molesta]